MSERKIKVLIVDDSLTFRKAVECALSDQENISLEGSVHNGVKALELIMQNPPDVVTLDIEMPEMDGIDTLRQIMEFNRSHSPQIGVIMLSALTQKGSDKTLQALAMGAFDFISKPAFATPEENEDALKRQLITKINVFASTRRTGGPAKNIQRTPQIQCRNTKTAPVDAIFIGISTGGPKSLLQMIPVLSEKTTLPMLITQHMPPLFTKSLAEQLDAKSNASVNEAVDGEKILPSHIYIAPGGKHMMVKGRSIILNDQPPENGCKPSVDVLFRSAASEFGSRALAVIMTGMGRDGTLGAGTLKRAGSYVMAQDEASSVVWGMPSSAIEAGVVDEVQSLMNIPAAIEKILRIKNGN